jgi:hypothetical protein
MKYSTEKQMKAAEYWYSLNPMQRYEIMQKVEYSKSVTTTFRRCIAYIIESGLA